MSFFNYFATLDIITIVALAILGVVAFVRRETFWFMAMTAVFAIWAIIRIFHLF